ncbi:cold shock domain-containing protein [Chitinispirillales bacterium ANBcel5]|uniref:cold-shock protein n=1 Tax=Cellulosispirillum alkaliphilum TaxID=3039283 RepID=UPI002A51FEAC|nr:cold shock domain-containing protein [Chitinispirillales bacterium ANBcel5]
MDKTHITGTVVLFNDITGTGYIRSDTNSLFKVKHSDLCRSGYKILDEGQRVSFIAVRRDEGLCAEKVEPL